MNITCEQRELQGALAALGRLVKGRSPLPVLAGVLLETDDDGRLRLRHTNFEVDATISIAASVTEAGAVIADRNVLTGLVQTLAPGTVSLASEGENQVSVRAGACQSTLNCLAVGDFPTMPAIEGAQLRLSGAVLTQAINSVAYAAARATYTLPVLRGAQIQIKGGELELTASDGYRLARYRTEVAGVTSDCDFVADGDTLTAIMRELDGEEVTLTVNSRQAVFTARDMTVITLLLSYPYPDVSRAIPRTYQARITVETKPLWQALRTAMITTEKDLPVRLTCTETGLKILGSSEDVGVTESVIPAQVELAADPQQARLAVSPAYLMDVLQATDTPEVHIDLNGEGSPVKVSTENGQWLAVVMPMFVQW